jgi:hypothetical protein
MITSATPGTRFSESLDVKHRDNLLDEERAVGVPRARTRPAQHEIIGWPWLRYARGLDAWAAVLGRVDAVLNVTAARSGSRIFRSNVAVIELTRCCCCSRSRTYALRAVDLLLDGYGHGRFRRSRALARPYKSCSRRTCGGALRVDNCAIGKTGNDGGAPG